MTRNKKIDKTKLYEIMVRTEKEAYEAQDNLLDTIKKWFLKVMDKDSADHTKIMLAHGGYIQIRTILKLDIDTLNGFCADFNFEQVWFRDETMVDYRNVETVSAQIFEYAFIPKNIDEIVGDNQVDLINEED